MKVKPSQPAIKLVSDGYTIAVKSVDEAMNARFDVITKLFQVVTLGIKKTQKNQQTLKETEHAN